MICKPAPKSRSESNDLQTHSENQIICDPCSEVPIWIKRFANPLRSSDLNQMIYVLRFVVPVFIMIREPAPKSRSESNDSRSALQSSDQNQKICEPAPKIWSKSNASRSALCSPDLKNESQTIILDRDYSVSEIILDNVLWSPDLNQILNRLLKMKQNSKMKCSFDLFFFLEVNCSNWMI